MEYFTSAAVAFTAYKALSTSYNLVAPCLKCGGYNLKKRYGDGYAVVTGGSAGLGFAYANEFAKRGINVMLVSRSEKKLEAAKQAINKKYPDVSVDCISADFNNLQDADTKRLQAKFAAVEVACLVNNCGLSYKHAEYLSDISDELVDRIIEVNVRSLTRMTRLVLPGMLERKRGDIINVTSADGTMQTGAPFYAVYSGSKGYVSLFSKSLGHEMRGRGIRVQCHVPFYVATEMSKQKPSWPLVPTPKTWAASAVASIGGSDILVTPWYAHNMLDMLVNALPLGIAANYITGHNKHIRKRALRKAEILAFQTTYLESHPEAEKMSEKDRRKVIRAAYDASKKRQ